jgi:hypothetical protein
VERSNRFGGNAEYVVPVAGHTKPLYFAPGIYSCGKITNGVAFEFGDEGGWIVALDDLQKIIDLAIQHRVNASSTVVELKASFLQPSVHEVKPNDK